MYDLIVFCVNQSTPCISFPESNIIIEAEKRYCDIWKYIVAQSGIWYTLLADKDEVGGTMLCENIDFDSTLNFPGTNKETCECLTPFRICQQYYNQFKIIINYLLDCSPAKMVLVLGRYQSDETEMVLGTYSLEKYLSLMQSNQVYSNVCYIISKHPNALQN